MSPCNPLLTTSYAPSDRGSPYAVFATYLLCGAASTAVHAACDKLRPSTVRTRPGSPSPGRVLPGNAMGAMGMWFHCTTLCWGKKKSRVFRSMFLALCVALWARHARPERPERPSTQCYA